MQQLASPPPPPSFLGPLPQPPPLQPQPQPSLRQPLKIYAAASVAEPYPKHSDAAWNAHLRMFVTPAEEQERPRRVGGISEGEGGWRLVPLSKEQAYTFYVGFTIKALGPGAWHILRDAAAEDEVTIRLRGNKSSGHHDSVHDHRSLTVYGVDVEKVEHHVGQIFDTAVEKGIDPRTFRLPKHWQHILERQLPKLPLPTLPPSLPQEESFLPDWGDEPESQGNSACLPRMLVTPPPRIRINFVSVGTRFLGSLAGFC